MGKSRWYFSSIADELETDIRELLGNEDVVDEDFQSVADAANDEMVSVFASLLNDREDAAVVAAIAA